MITRTKKFSIPEYREKKSIYEVLGYQEVSYEEKGINCFVTLQIDETSKNYHALRRLEHELFPKGPSFIPIVLLVIVAFVLISMFVILLGRSVRDKSDFDLISNFLSFLLPAFIVLFLDVVYTLIYFKIHRRLIEKGSLSKEFIYERVEEIKKENQ